MAEFNNTKRHIVYALTISVFSICCSALCASVFAFPVISLLCASLAVTAACALTDRISISAVYFLSLGALSYAFSLLICGDLADSLYSLIYIFPSFGLYVCIVKNKLRTTSIICSSALLLVFALPLLFWEFYRSFGMPDKDFLDMVYTKSLEYANRYVAFINETAAQSQKIPEFDYNAIKLAIDSLLVTIPSFFAVFSLLWSYAATAIHRYLARSIKLESTDYYIWLPTMSRASAFIFLSFSFLYFLTGFSDETLSLFVVFVNNVVSIMTPGFLLLGLRYLKKGFKRGFINMRVVLVFAAIFIISSAVSPYTLPYTVSSLINITAIWGALGVVFSKIIKKIPQK